MMSLEQFVIVVYCMVDDLYRAIVGNVRFRTRGPAPRLSDVDVLVVMPERRQAGYRAVLRIREKVRARFPVDLLVHGSRDIARRIKDRESFFLDVTEKGRVMYEAGHA